MENNNINKIIFGKKQKGNKRQAHRWDCLGHEWLQHYQLHFYSTKSNKEQVQEMLKNALDCFNSAILCDMQGAGHYQGLAKVFEEMGLVDKAENALNEAVELAPNCPIAYRIRGDFFYRNNRLDLAEEDFVEMLKLNPNCINYCKKYKRSFYMKILDKMEELEETEELEEESVVEKKKEISFTM